MKNLRWVEREELRTRKQETRVVPVLLFLSCVTLGKLFNPLGWLQTG